MQKIVIELDFYQTLKGGGSEMVEVTFVNSKIYVDAAGNGLTQAPLSGELNSYEYIDPLVKA